MQTECIANRPLIKRTKALSSRDDFTQATKRSIGQRAGWACSNPECRKPTEGPKSSGESGTSIGVAAHVTAASEGGPRFDGNLTSEERRSVSNGLWLCQDCAHVIDHDEHRFSAPVLFGWKQFAEQNARVALGKQGDQKEHVNWAHLTFERVSDIGPALLGRPMGPSEATACPELSYVEHIASLLRIAFRIQLRPVRCCLIRRRTT